MGGEGAGAIWGESNWGQNRAIKCLAGWVGWSGGPQLCAALQTSSPLTFSHRLKSGLQVSRHMIWSCGAGCGYAQRKILVVNLCLANKCAINWDRFWMLANTWAIDWDWVATESLQLSMELDSDCERSKASAPNWTPNKQYICLRTSKYFGLYRLFPFQNSGY